MKNNNMQERNFTEYRVEYLTEDTYWVAKEFKTQQDAFSFMEKVKIEYPKHNWQVTKLSYVYEKVSQSN